MVQIATRGGQSEELPGPDLERVGAIGTEGEQSVVYITAAARPIYADMEKDGIVARKNLPPSPTAGE